MENLKMHTPDLAEENFKKLAAMFPNAVTETINEDGEVVRAIDADVLSGNLGGCRGRRTGTLPVHMAG